MFQQKIRAYGDPRLFALSLVADQITHSVQPLVPERLFVMNGGDGDGAHGKPELGSMSVLGQLLALLLAEKSGLGLSEAGGAAPGPGTAVAPTTPPAAPTAT